MKAKRYKYFIINYKSTSIPPSLFRLRIGAKKVKTVWTPWDYRDNVFLKPVWGMSQPLETFLGRYKPKVISKSKAIETFPEYKDIII